ncbi:MAG: tRNA N6-adenosine threonylcarbamoyltransferase [Verrucomicrobiales bacterium]|nr:tRNA N6-adenosine threonylcarbamoyltransferase [Verrucomicrobiales bacterium]
MSPLILALETSCDESAVALCDAGGHIPATAISSQIPDHQPYGGVVPELASRNHLLRIRPLIQQVLRDADVRLSDISAFAATSGPGLASSLLVGSTIAKSLALACGKPYLAVNHLEGHLLSPFLGKPGGIQPGIALIVSGGHTLLLHLRGPGDYEILGRTRDDAAGEAFDKVARMLGLPYPGGPEIDKLARSGNPAAFDFPRSMKSSGDYSFSFSGLKTSMFYLLPTLGDSAAGRLPDLCASFQEAVTDILVSKTLAAAKALGAQHISVSGGVSCNSRLRALFTERAAAARLTLHLAAPAHTTDNAAMIAFAALQRFKNQQFSSLDSDIDPNLSL